MKKPTRHPIIITGAQHIERLSDTQSRDDHDSGLTDNSIAFGFKSLTITKKGITRPLSKDDDKFIAYGATLEEARQTFWARWSIFCKRAFNRNYVPIYK